MFTDGTRSYGLEGEEGGGVRVSGRGGGGGHDAGGIRIVRGLGFDYTCM